MKVYVDGELPKNCDDCEFGYFYDCQYCTLRPDLAREDIWVEKEKHCPLLSIESLKQQVREEVVGEIKRLCEKEKEENDLAWLGFKKLNKILDKVKGENNDN